MEDFFKRIHLPKLTSEQSDHLVAEITEKEISSVILNQIRPQDQTGSLRNGAK